MVTSLAGSPGLWGSADGIGSAASFYDPYGVAVDSSGNVYVADLANCTLRKITPAGVVTTLAGMPGIAGGADGIGTVARFYQPFGVAVDASGKVYIADTYNYTIRLGSPAIADVATIDSPAGAIGALRQLDTAPQTATSWSWSIILRPPGSTASLSSETLRNPTFTPDAGDRYRFQCIAASATGTSVTTIDLMAQNSLTITAIGTSKTYGAANPVFSVGYSGLLTGDSASNLGGTLTFATGATSGSPAGIYPVMPGGLTSNRYAITFVAGNLTITPGPLDHFALVLGLSQPDAVRFAGVNTLTAQDAGNNTITSYDASANSVTISVNPPLTGVVSGLGTGGARILNRANDFVNGVADLTALGMVYTGNLATGTFTATSMADSKTGTSGNVTIVGPLDHFALALASPQANAAGFIGVNTLTAQDASNNTITFFDAAANNVTISVNAPLTGIVSGLGTGRNNVLNKVTDFVNGAANLTGLGFVFTGNLATGTFTAASTAGSKTGTSGNVTIVGPFDHFALALASPQTNAVGFTGVNTLTAQDAGNNTITTYDASANSVTISVNSPLTGVVSGLGTGYDNVLDKSTDFVNGVADLTALGMVYTGNAATGTFTATSTADSKTGTSGNVVIVGPLDHFALVLASPQTNAAEFTGVNTLTAQDSGNNTITSFDASADNVMIWGTDTLTGTVSGLGMFGDDTLDQSTDFVNGVADLTALGMVYTGNAATGTFTFFSTASGNTGTSGDVTINPAALDHFALMLASPQANAELFTGANTLTAQDASNNTITSYDASANNVAISVDAALTGAVSGLGTGNDNVLDNATDFVNGVADLSALGMVYTGNAATVTFTATSTASGQTGTSDFVAINPGALDHFVLVLNTPQANAVGFTGVNTLTAQDISNNAITSYDASADNVTILVNAALIGTVSGLGTGSNNVLNNATDFVNGVADLSALGMVYTGNAATGTFTAISDDGVTVTSALVTINPGALDHFVLALAGSETNVAAFAGANTLTTYDVSNNVIRTFDASANPVLIFANTPLTGTVSGLGTTHDNLLDSAGDFVGGIADLTALGMTYSGNAATGTFTATSVLGSKTGTSGNVTISLLTQTITFNALANQTYGVSAFALSATSDSGLPVSYAVTGPATVTGNTLTITGAGNITVQATQAGNGNYSAATPMKQSFTVNPATLSITANNATKVFNTSNPAFSATYNGFVNGDTAASLAGTLLLTTTAVTGSNVGAYPITPSGQSSANYTIAFNNGTLTVTPASAAVALNGLNATFDGTAKSATVTTTPAGLANSVTYDGSATAPTEAGSYAVDATITNPNYTGSANGTLTIAQVIQTITFGALANQTYGASAFALSAISDSGLPVNYAVTSGPATVAGNTLTITGAGNVAVQVTQAGNANYSAATPVNQSFTVNPAALSITANDATTVFNTAIPAFSATYSGFVNGDTTASLTGALTLTTTAVTGSNVGAYPITPSGQSSANYTIAFNNGTLTVTPAAATVTLSGLATTFDFAAQAVTVATNPAGLSVSITYNGSASAPTNAGSYTVAATITDPNYTGNAIGTFAIAKATPLITWANPTAIIAGTALSATQLNATANIPGTFIYDPPAGTVLGVGANQALAAFFTPTDGTNHDPTSAQVAITVSAGTPLISSQPTATPNPAIAGQPTVFAAVASEAGNAALSYSWNFGDGSTATGNIVTHVYAAAGTFNTTLTVSDAANAAITASVSVTVNIAGGGAPSPFVISSADGIPDDMQSAASAAGINSAAQPQTLPDVTLAIKLNFAKPGSDSIALSGTLVRPAGFSATGQSIVIDVGGVVTAFALNAQGKIKNGNDMFSIAMKGTAASSARFSMKLNKGNFAAPLAKAGLTNAAAKAKPVNIPVAVLFAGELWVINQPQLYTATSGKSGATKNAK